MILNFESTHNYIFQSHHYVQTDNHEVFYVCHATVIECTGLVLRMSPHTTCDWQSFVDALTGEKSLLYMACMLYSPKLIIL